MNREIKFRVWTGLNMDYKIMVGFLGAFYVSGIDERDSATMSHYNTKYPDYTDVMQYTGLKDKNGKEIYEGDVVLYDDEKWEVKFDYDRWDMVRKVFFINELIDHTPRSNDLSDDPGMTVWEDCEVIGNIFEDPELLK